MGIKKYYLLLVIFSLKLYSEDIFVSKNQKTIKEAILQAKNGDKIIISSGVYFENEIIVDKKIDFVGINYPVIDGQNRKEIFLVLHDSVSFTNLEFKNAGISYVKDNSAIRIENSKYCKIKNNKFVNNYFAIYLARTSNSEISENIIQSVGSSESSSGNGIHLWNCNEILISKNKINGHRDGVYLEFSKKCLIKNNLSYKNIRYGLHFMYSDNCSYYENTFSQNGSGVAVMYSNEIEMLKNNFVNNQGTSSYGLLFKDIKASRVEGNYISKNSVGLYMEASSKINIENNVFDENGFAIRLMANSTDNFFNENNFISNSFDVATNSKSNFNCFEKNYWDKYNGYDLNKDGLGDVPYRPVKLFSVINSNYPTTLILLKSLFVDLLNLSEEILPSITPIDLIDKNPTMKYNYD